MLNAKNASRPSRFMSCNATYRPAATKIVTFFETSERGKPLIVADRQGLAANDSEDGAEPPAVRLSRSLLFGLEDGFVAVVIGEFDLDGAVVEQFGRAVAGDFVHFVEAFPVESDRRAAVFDVEAGLERAETDFVATEFGDRHCRGHAKIEVIAVPDVGLGDPPTDDELAVGRRAHAACARSLGNRARL